MRALRSVKLGRAAMTCAWSRLVAWWGPRGDEVAPLEAAPDEIRLDQAEWSAVWRRPDSRGMALWRIERVVEGCQRIPGACYSYVMVTAQHPIPDSYWLRPGRLLAGEYPGALRRWKARDKLRRLLAAGVTFFLDLTEEGDLPPYAPLLREMAVDPDRPIEHHRLPIRDFGLPSPEQMRRTLDTIDAALAAGHVVYVHCWAGMGRTGTVAGCYLVRHGMSGEEALREIARLRVGTPKGRWPSPETEAQRRMVLEWRESTRGERS